MIEGDWGPRFILLRDFDWYYHGVDASSVPIFFIPFGSTDREGNDDSLLL